MTLHPRQRPGKLAHTGKSGPRAGIIPAEIGQLLQQGMQAQRKGQLWAALECYQAILDRDPNQPDALHLMALISLEARRLEPALEMLKRAVGRKPADPALRASYATALVESNDPVAAEKQLRRAVKLSQNHPDLSCQLASCLAILGREDDARRMFEDVLAHHPERPAAIFRYADFLLQTGEHENAQRVYRGALEKGINPGRALAGLAKCQTFRARPRELDDIEELLGRPGLSASEAVTLSQAAAKISNDIGDYDGEFRHFAAAKAVFGSDYDGSLYVRRFDAARAIFTPDFFAKRKGYGNASPKPVFIVGMPRSGTTLTEQIIASHPMATGAGEIGILRKFALSLGSASADEKEFARRLKALAPNQVNALAREGLAILGRFSTSAARITDKLPHNFAMLGLAALLYPKARIVHCRRNPVDTCVSCYLTPLSESHDYAQDLKSLGEYYREYSSLMDHWRAVLPVPILEVDYEALVADPEAQSRRLIEFVGLEWDPAVLEFYSKSRAVHTISQFQVRQPIYRTSVERWRRYERHLGPLLAALGDLAP